ncbi:MAG TPA: SMC-Scp complex subunit ScpB [Syntrophomonadaceae bacterium]|nr:SMC-Scp complex subunit ScpB [Syntrophomonadaceae bacterium]
MPVIFPKETMAILDALLFSSSEPLTLARLSSLLGLLPEDVKQLLGELQKLYDQPGHGLQLVEVAQGYQLVTRKEYHPYVQKLQQEREKEPPLSSAALETLSIIAYYQPVTRARIESIRGVKVDHVLATLLDRGLIKEVGRGEGPGRPLLYGTTTVFLETFGLKSLDDLPPLEPFEKPE